MSLISPKPDQMSPAALIDWLLGATRALQKNAEHRRVLRRLDRLEPRLLRDVGLPADFAELGPRERHFILSPVAR